MTEQTTVISVRGEAELPVAPDLATVFLTIRVERESHDAAMRAVAVALDAVLADLRDHGGVVAVAGQRIALSWTAGSLNSHEVVTHDKPAGESRRTGRYEATVSVTVVVREFGLLSRLATTLGAHDAIAVDLVNWTVDDDNAGWPKVRALAIDAAIQRGRDYADALRGRLVSVDHVADSGLLGSDTVSFGRRGGQARASSADWSDSSPSLDPVPQMLRAVIEARFVAAVAALA